MLRMPSGGPAGNSHITEGGHVLHGKAAAIYEILATDENEEDRTRVA